MTFLRKAGNWALRKARKNFRDGFLQRVRTVSLCIGADGCRGGWIAAVIDNGKLRVEKYTDIASLVNAYPEFDSFLIDMVIGLQETAEDVRPDSYARNLIRQRSSTIFSSPSRQAVYEESDEEKRRANIAALGKSLSSQAIAIFPKIREIDEFMNCHREYRNIIQESHPEVCFARLNGNVVMSKKNTFEGMMERIRIMSQYLPGISSAYILNMEKRLHCNADDIIDAVCLAITANLSMQGLTEPIPPVPQKDSRGLLMQMIIPKEECGTY